MTHRVGAKGQVVIPKELRESFGIDAGDEVVFWQCDDHVALRPVGSATALRGRFKGMDLISCLNEQRSADRLRERSE